MGALIGRLERLPWRLMGWSAATVLLLAPLVAMQFTDEVVWGPLDFTVAAAMLGAVGLGFELVFHNPNWFYRAGAVLGIGAAFMLTWSNVAVGVFLDEGHPANLMVWVVLVLTLIGVVASRLRPTGMARAMAAAAIGTVVITGIALARAWEPHLQIMAFFATLWLASAGLFRRAAR